jgi:hypothetical protein
MFRSTAPVAEAGQIEQDCHRGDNADLIPCSYLGLDLPEPTVGWQHYLSNRSIQIVSDDLGRDCINRADVRLLLDERREAEARRLEAIQRQEQLAIEAYQTQYASIWRGVSADHMPAGVAPAAAMLQSAKDAEPKRTTPLEHALSNSGGMTYHAWPSEDEE